MTDFDFDAAVDNMVKSRETEPETNGFDFDAAVDKMTHNRAAMSVDAAIESVPDDQAAFMNISRQTGVPPKAVPEYRKSLERRIRKEEIDRVLRHSPSTGKFMSDPENAKLAHDDVENLSFAEKAWDWYTEDYLGELSDFAETAAEAAYQGARSTSKGLDTISRTIGDVRRAITEPIFGPEPETEYEGLGTAITNLGLAITGSSATADQLPDTLGFDTEAYATWEEVKADPTEAGSFIVGQMAHSLPETAALMANAPAGFFMMWSRITEERAKNDGREEANLTDAIVSIPATILSGVLDRMGGQTSLGIRDTITKGDFGEIITSILNAGVTEGVTEFAQEGIEQITATLGTEEGYDGWKTLDTMIAASVGGAGMGVTLRTPTAVIEAGTLKEQQRRIVETIKDINSGDSNLRERMPEKWAEHQADVLLQKGVDTVHIDAEGVQILQQESMKQVQIRQSLMWDDTEMQETVETGSDMQVGVEEFWSLPMEVIDQLADHVSLSASQESMAVLEEVERLARATGVEADRIFEDMAGVEAEDYIFTDQYDQLVRSGAAASSPASARASARLAAVGISNIAKRGGHDPVDFYNRMGPIVRGEITKLFQTYEPDHRDYLIDKLKRAVSPGLESKMFGDSLLEFISRRGGIYDIEGDLKAMDLDKWHLEKKFRRKIVQDTARSTQTDIEGKAVDVNSDLLPDYVREAAEEAGYLPEGSTVADLYNAISEELGGNPTYIFNEMDQDALAEKQAIEDLDQLTTMYNIDLNREVHEIRADIEALEARGDDADVDTFEQSDILDEIFDEFEELFGDLEYTPEQQAAADEFIARNEALPTREEVEAKEIERLKAKVEDIKRYRDRFPDRSDLAIWTDDRINSVIRQNAHANGRETKGQMAMVDPIDFVLSTSTKSYLPELEQEAGDLDPQELANQKQTPYLIIENGKIIGHEGRHRMIAMAKAGVKSVPIMIKDYGRNYDTPDYKISSMNLEAQYFLDQGKAMADLVVRDVTPALWDFKEDFRQTMQRGADDVRIMFQSDDQARARRNGIGLYSGAEQKVIDLKLPQWKVKPALTPVLSKELEDLNADHDRKIEDLYRQGLPEGELLDAKMRILETPEYARRKELQSLKNKDDQGHTAAAATARGQDVWNKLKSEGLKKEELQWLGLEEFLTVDPNAKFSRQDVIKFIQNNGVRVDMLVADGESDFELDWEEEELSADEMERMGFEDFTERANDLMYDGEYEDRAIEAIRDQEEDYILQSTGEEDINDVSDDWVRENFADEIDQIAREDAERDARSMYEDDPWTQYYDRETNSEIVGNDSVGYLVNGHWVDAYSFNEAEIRVREEIEESGDTPEGAARWSEYVMDGDHDNYREIKLTLPDVPGDFVESVHFDDPNIVAFLRVDDRDLRARDDRVAEQTPVEFDIAVEQAEGRKVGTIRRRDDNTLIWSVALNDSVDADGWAEKLTGFMEERDGRSLAGSDFKQGYSLDRGKINYTPDTQRDLSGVKNTYFIDEFQSDWHSTGRKKGYYDPQGGTDPSKLSMSMTETRERGEEIFELMSVEGQMALDKLVNESVMNGDLQDINPVRILTQVVSGSIDKSQYDAGKLFGGLNEMYKHPRYGADVKNIADEVQLYGEQYKQREAVKEGAPDAPFKGDAWLTMGLKAAIVNAVENKYDAIAWPNAMTLQGRWSSGFDYTPQYDQKMPSIIKKLMKGQVRQFEIDGDEIPARLTELPDDWKVEKEGDWFVVYNADGDMQTSDEVKETAIKETAIKEAIEEFNAAHVDVEGYHIIEITPELRQSVLDNSYTLFQKARGQVTFRRDQRPIIDLHKGNDLSTYLHEMGHVFLEMMDVAANSATADQSLIDDMKAVNEWLGPKDPATGRFTVEQHEKWAETFEVYLKEGRAPSSRLAEAFNSFRSWLISIYTRLVNDNLLRRADLTDEMRDVFDRMLATEDEIAEARNAARMHPLFKDAETAGMSEDEYDQYTKDIERADQSAKTELMARLMRDVKREMTKWWNSDLIKKRNEVLLELDNDPAWFARYVLQLGRMPSGSPVPAYIPQPIKLSRQGVIEVAGDGAERTLPGGISGMIRKEGGYHPDQVAEMLGFSSGSELIKALQLLPRDPETNKYMSEKVYAETIAEDRMKQEHGDVLNDGTIHEEALARLHSENQARVIEREMKALNKTRRTSRQTMKQAAQRIIREKQVGKIINHRNYLNAERKAAMEAAEAVASGDMEAAFEAKQRQLINFYLYREARDVAEKVDKMTKRMRGWQVKKIEPRIIHPDFIKQVKALLSGISFGPKIGQRRMDRLSSETLQRWMDESTEKYGASFHMSPMLDAALEDNNYRDMTFEEFEGLHDTAKSIIDQGRRYNDFKQSQFNNMVKELADSVDEHAVRTRDDVIDRGLWDRAKSFGRLAMAEMRQMQSLFLEMDGGEYGPVWRAVFQRIKQADDRFMDRSMEAARGLNDIINKYTTKEKLKFNSKTYIPELDASLSLNARLAFALNMGNSGNVDAMLNEYDQSQIDAVLETLTDKDWDVVEDIWAFIDQFWPDLSDLEERMTGVKPAKVEAVPFTTPSGREVTGGYYPLMADPERTSAGRKDFDDRDSVNGFMNKGHGKTTTKHGSTIERKGFGNDRKIWMDLRVAFDHVDGVLKDIELREAVFEVHRIINHRDFEAAVKQSKGKEYHQAMNLWLENVVGANRDPSTTIEKIVQYMRTGVSIAEMGLSLRTVLQQPFGITQTVALIGERYAARGVAKFAMNRSDAAREVMQLSSFMRNRAATFNRDVREASRFTGMKGLQDKVVAASFWGIQKLDMTVSIPSWLGAYDKAIDDGMTGQDAIDYADSIVARGQGSGLPREMSDIQQGSTWKKMFTMFYTFFNAYYNLQTDLYKQTDFKSPASALKYAKNQIWVTLIPSLLVDYLFNGGPEDDEEWYAWASKILTGYSVSGVVGVRDFANALVTGFDYQPTPATNVLKTAATLSTQVEQGELDAAAVKAGIMFTGYTLHIPMSRTAARATDYLMNEGTDDLDSFEGWWQLLVQGRER